MQLALAFPMYSAINDQIPGAPPLTFSSPENVNSDNTILLNLYSQGGYCITYAATVFFLSFDIVSS